MTSASVPVSSVDEELDNTFNVPGKSSGLGCSRGGVGVARDALGCAVAWLGRELSLSQLLLCCCTVSLCSACLNLFIHIWVHVFM